MTSAGGGAGDDLGLGGGAGLGAVDCRSMLAHVFWAGSGATGAGAGAGALCFDGGGAVF